MPDFAHGSKAIFSLDATDIQSSLDSLDFEMSGDPVDSPALGDLFKTPDVAQVGTVIALEGSFNPTINSQLAAIISVKNPTKAFIYGPQGSAAGKPKISGNCKLIHYRITTGKDGAGGWQAQLMTYGVITFGVYP